MRENKTRWHQTSYGHSLRLTRQYEVYFILGRILTDRQRERERERERERDIGVTQQTDACVYDLRNGH
jgi:hypothetical protein